LPYIAHPMMALMNSPLVQLKAVQLRAKQAA
jgi:hypothetical protein